MSKADESRIAQEPQSFAMAVYQFFLSGGRIKTDDLNRYLRKETGEKGGDKMLWAHAKDGISLDKLHEMPQFEQFMTGMTGVDGVNAFIDVLNSVKGKKDIRTKLDALLANNGQPAPEQVPQDEGGIRTKPSQEQSGSEKQQVEPAEVKAPEETPAEVKPEEKPQENIPVKQEFAGEALSELPPMDMEELMAMDFADEDITKAKIKCIKLPKGGITL
jgi:hypothetical protein